MRSLTRARFGIWDAIVFADYKKPRFLWTARTIYICHGVAAKRTLRFDDYRYHPSLKEYDLFFFIMKRITGMRGYGGYLNMRTAGKSWACAVLTT
jgi:hypothetical protein